MEVGFLLGQADVVVVLPFSATVVDLLYWELVAVVHQVCLEWVEQLALLCLGLLVGYCPLCLEQQVKDFLLCLEREATGSLLYLVNASVAYHPCQELVEVLLYYGVHVVGLVVGLGFL